jgi:hypothetical protein
MTTKYSKSDSLPQWMTTSVKNNQFDLLKYLHENGCEIHKVDPRWIPLNNPCYVYYITNIKKSEPTITIVKRKIYEMIGWK